MPKITVSDGTVATSFEDFQAQREANQCWFIAVLCKEKCLSIELALGKMEAGLGQIEWVICGSMHQVIGLDRNKKK